MRHHGRVGRTTDAGVAGHRRTARRGADLVVVIGGDACFLFGIAQAGVERRTVGHPGGRAAAHHCDADRRRDGRIAATGRAERDVLDHCGGRSHDADAFHGVFELASGQGLLRRQLVVVVIDQHAVVDPLAGAAPQRRHRGAGTAHFGRRRRLDIVERDTAGSADAAAESHTAGARLDEIVGLGGDRRIAGCAHDCAVVDARGRAAARVVQRDRAGEARGTRCRTRNRPHVERALAFGIDTYICTVGSATRQFRAYFAADGVVRTCGTHRRRAGATGRTGNGQDFRLVARLDRDVTAGIQIRARGVGHRAVVDGVDAERTGHRHLGRAAAASGYGLDFRALAGFDADARAVDIRAGDLRFGRVVDHVVGGADADRRATERQRRAAGDRQHAGGVARRDDDGVVVRLGLRSDDAGADRVVRFDRRERSGYRHLVRHATGHRRGVDSRIGGCIHLQFAIRRAHVGTAFDGRLHGIADLAPGDRCADARVAAGSTDGAGQREDFRVVLRQHGDAARRVHAERRLLPSDARFGGVGDGVDRHRAGTGQRPLAEAERGRNGVDIVVGLRVQCDAAARLQVRIVDIHEGVVVELVPCEGQTDAGLSAKGDGTRNRLDAGKVARADERGAHAAQRRARDIGMRRVADFVDRHRTGDARLALGTGQTGRQGLDIPIDVGVQRQRAVLGDDRIGDVGAGGAGKRVLRVRAGDAVAVLLGRNGHRAGQRVDVQGVVGRDRHVVRLLDMHAARNVGQRVGFDVIDRRVARYRDTELALARARTRRSGSGRTAARRTRPGHRRAAAAVLGFARSGGDIGLRLAVGGHGTGQRIGADLGVGRGLQRQVVAHLDDAGRRCQIEDRVAIADEGAHVGVQRVQGNRQADADRPLGDDDAARHRNGADLAVRIELQVLARVYLCLVVDVGDGVGTHRIHRQRAFDAHLFRTAARLGHRDQLAVALGLDFDVLFGSHLGAIADARDRLAADVQHVGRTADG